MLKLQDHFNDLCLKELGTEYIVAGNVTDTLQVGALVLKNQA